MIDFDLRWLILIPVVPTLGFMAWRLLDRYGWRQGITGLVLRRRSRVEVWD